MTLLNDLKWIAELQNISNETGEDDRPRIVRTKIRDLYYTDLGIAAEEKFLSQQSKTNVVRRIKCRYDKLINEKDKGICIGKIEYNIVRIYELPKTREMDLSLAYVN